MNEPTMETLARRLDRVERENRRLKRAGLVSLAVIAAVVLMGQAKGGNVANVVEAESFILRDVIGNPRAMFGVGAKNMVRLSIFDKDGVIPCIWLGTLADGSAIMGLTDQTGQTRAGLRTFADGSPFLALNDKGGKVIWSAP